MSRAVVLTGVGRDRVGIVAELARVLYELGCNLLDSSMTLLRGEFAIILMVGLPEGKSIDELSAKVKEVEKKLGFNMNVRELTEQEFAESEPEGAPHIISVYGADRPGIVAGITRELADKGVNITDVATKRTEEGLFLMVLEVMSPQQVETSDIERALDGVSKKLSVDITVRALEIMEL